MEQKKYVVIEELNGGYMDCVAVCDSDAEAYGKAYLALTKGLDPDAYYVTLPHPREGGNGYVIEVKNRKDKAVLNWATILYYDPNEEINEEK